jgi:hypothetical protein
MQYWELFWTAFLLVSGFSFAFITFVVTIKGFRDLLGMFYRLSQQQRESSNE